MTGESPLHDTWNDLLESGSFCQSYVLSPVASPRGGGGQAGQLVPPPTSDRTPREIDADPRRFSCPKKMGVGLQVLLRRFTCTDATADVLWSYDYEKRGSCGSCSGRPSVKLRGIFQSWHWPSQAYFLFFVFVFIFKCGFGTLPKNSGSNPTSFHFLTGGRLT